MTHLFLRCVVVECCPSLLVAGKHAITIAVFLYACAGCRLCRCTRAMVHLCAVGTTSFGIGRLWTELVLFLRRRDLVAVSGAQIGRSVCVCRKCSWDVVSVQLTHWGHARMCYLSTWCCVKLSGCSSGTTNFQGRYLSNALRRSPARQLVRCHSWQSLLQDASELQYSKECTAG
jgi:hypothetical protein